MDPLATTPQNDDIDPLELEDQELPDEETAELAHIEDPEAPEAMAVVTQEEQDLNKILDTITKDIEVPDLEEVAASTSTSAKKGAADAKGSTDAAADAPVKKPGSHIIPRHLIDRELTTEDLFDAGAL
jgi:hypothetical protein